MGEIISIKERKEKKQIEEALAKGRVPLCNTHEAEANMIDRLRRIRESLEKINQLMLKLKEPYSDKDIEGKG